MIGLQVFGEVGVVFPELIGLKEEEDDGSGVGEGFAGSGDGGC